MKIKTAHRLEIENSMMLFCHQYEQKNGAGSLLRYQNEVLANDPRISDIQKRLRWDLFRAAGFPCMKEVYEYANDSHIDTVLRDVMTRLTRVYF